MTMRQRTAPLVVLLALVLAACSSGPAGRAAPSPATDRADVVVVTIIDEEYRAMLRWLEEPRALPYRSDRWAVGELRGQYPERAPRVVVVGAGEEGEVSGALSTLSAIERWRPPVVLLVGIAGGIEDSVSLGDVVVATAIWDYDIGHLGETFEPGSTRFAPDAQLLKAARRVPADWTRGIQIAPPQAGAVPRVVEAEVASGDKVIETERSAFFAAVDRADSGFAAVEMEGAGAAAAIQRAKVSGEATRFLMIRGVSDLVQPHPADAPVGAAVARNPQRAAWREYAADAAATFAAEVIRQHWRDAGP
jgi:adenosylhomocysteine nucleosidase